MAADGIDELDVLKADRQAGRLTESQTALQFWRFFVLARLCRRGQSRAAKGWRAGR